MNKYGLNKRKNSDLAELILHLQAIVKEVGTFVINNMELFN